MNSAKPRTITVVPYVTYAVLWAVLFFFTVKFLPRESFGFNSNDSETALTIVKANLWQDELLRTLVQLLVIPCAVFGALRTGSLTIRGLVATAFTVYMSIAVWVAWVLDVLKPSNQVSFFSIQGLLNYQFWEFFIWQLAVNTIVPVLALVAIRHLSSRSSGTPTAPLN